MKYTAHEHIAPAALAIKAAVDAGTDLDKLAADLLSEYNANAYGTPGVEVEPFTHEDFLDAIMNLCGIKFYC